MSVANRESYLGEVMGTQEELALLIRDTIPLDQVTVLEDDGDHGTIWVSIEDSVGSCHTIGGSYSEDKNAAARCEVR
jgi:hypothetical protein